MIPAITLNKIVLSTGNILKLNNKLASKSNELEDGLKLTLQCNENAGPNADGQILRGTQELKQKITEHDRNEISIGAKLFLKRKSSDCIREAVRSMLQILEVQHVNNLVLANSTCTSDQLNVFWGVLEEFALNKQIERLGVADVNLETLSKLHADARVQPTMAQINLASCCVVPADLKEYCAHHEIQLLTHSDPDTPLSDEFILPNFSVDWTLRYQIHVRCRGVLTAKGYIVGASNDEGST